MDHLAAKLSLGLAAALCALSLAACGPTDPAPPPARSYRSARAAQADREALRQQRREAVVRLSPKESPRLGLARPASAPAGERRR